MSTQIRIIQDNDVPILKPKMGVYVHFTKTSVKDPGKVRIRCEFHRRDEEEDAQPLARASFLCDATANYRLEVKQRAELLLQKKLARDSEKKELYDELFGITKPFELFFNMHFANLAILNGWAPSTVRQYEGTLKLLMNWLPNKLMADLTAEDFDAAIDAQREAYQQEDGGQYSDSRIGQFVDVLYSVMDYAASELMLGKNPVMESKYYNSTLVRSNLQPLETLVEKRLRSKGLEISEQIRVAEEITREIQSGNPLAIGTGIQLLTGMRPTEICGLRGRSIFPFAKEGWQHRNYLLVCNKVDTETGNLSYVLKTRYSYRAIPIQVTLQYWLDLHRKVQCPDATDEEFGARYLVTTSADGSKPIRSKKLCDYSAKLLRRSVSNPDFASLQIPVELDGEGKWVAQEANKNAYQFRRNYGSMLLNILGMDLCPDVQGLFGHKLLSEDLRRWSLNHEEDLIRKLEQLDKLVLLPARDASAEVASGQCGDPRNMVHFVDGCGSYTNVPALKLDAEPYSETDCVTVHLVLKTREPGDGIRVKLSSDAELQATVNRSYAEPDYFGEVNLQNDYLDEVFADPSKQRHTDVSDAPDAEIMVDDEDESYEDSSFVSIQEDVDEIYDAEEDLDHDEEGDDEEEI